jgi:hypothetical protein
MFSLRTWIVAFLVAMLISLFSPFAFAQRNGVNLRTTDLTTVDTSQPHEPAGSPEIGILIIIGLIGLLIVVAWLFSRIGEKGSHQSDGTLNWGELVAVQTDSQ